jgi:hypothetical protein
MDGTLFSGLPLPINDRVNYIIDPVTDSGSYYLDRNGRIAATCNYKYHRKSIIYIYLSIDLSMKTSMVGLEFHKNLWEHSILKNSSRKATIFLKKSTRKCCILFTQYL